MSFASTLSERMSEGCACRTCVPSSAITSCSCDSGTSGTADVFFTSSIDDADVLIWDVQQYRGNAVTLDPTQTQMTVNASGTFLINISVAFAVPLHNVLSFLIVRGAGPIPILQPVVSVDQTGEFFNGSIVVELPQGENLVVFIIYNSQTISKINGTFSIVRLF